MDAHSDFVASIVAEPFDPRAAFDDVLCAWLDRADAVVLEGSPAGHEFGRFSILAADPVESLIVTESCPRDCVVDQLAARHDALPRLQSDSVDLPFLGGWIGFLSYESGLAHERLTTIKPSDSGLPSAHFNLYDTALVFDAVSKIGWIVAVEWPPMVYANRGPAKARIACVRRWWDEAGTSHRRQRSFPQPNEPSPRPCQANLSKSQYRRLARRVQKYIDAGDVYQANLSIRFTARTGVPPDEQYRRLRVCNPAPFSAYFPSSTATILCASPELFLDLQGQNVRTRPIKGTRPRQGVPTVDKRARHELLVDEKERAELAMIVDLLRNDLGRVCEFGSVHVDDPASIEAHPTVFHRVATITGRLRDDRTWRDLLRSAFPGGSITGAPKIRAMQIIDDLEPTLRGVYCGAIGWLGLDRSMRFNVAIRTMVHVGSDVHIYAGGAITADSDPEHEYAEILAKAAGLFRAVGCQPPDEARRWTRAAKATAT